jgi:heme oxygenase
MTTLLERLRADTRAQHEEMEAVFALPKDREQHREWCAIFLGFLAPLEERLIATLGEVHPFLLGRAQKAAWLREDLLALGLDRAAIDALPRCTDLPAVDTPEKALGALYVFEGSTLGGQLISRHLESVVGLKDGAGYRYFRSYGPDVGRRWKEFGALMLQHSNPRADAEIVAAANDTFARLHAWCLACDHGRTAAAVRQE